MKNFKKIMLLVLCAALLMGISVMGTLAYLKAETAPIKNTMTVGKVAITLDEAKTDEYGKAVTGANRIPNGEVKGNSYKLIPGQPYTKDPTIHVDASSENCYVFVKVTNNVNQFIDIEDMVQYGWTALPGVDGVWYQKYEMTQTDKDLEVFTKFTVKTNANDVQGWAAINPNDNFITVTAYAIQEAGFADANAAWTAGQFQ